MDSQVAYGYNVIFPCYMLNREMINYSRVQSFFETFIRKTHSYVTNKRAPFERGMDLKD